VFRRHTAGEFEAMLIDQFDEMLEQSRKYPLVYSVALHPFIIGQPFRLRALRRALKHIMEHKDALWITTPGEIARYCEGLPKGIVPGS
jgi:allantoinase